MAWFRVQLTEEPQRIVNEERTSHPDLRVREKMLVLGCSTAGPRGRRPPRSSAAVVPPSTATSLEFRNS